MTNPELRRDLLAMQSEDLRVRADLDERGLLGDGYQPEMQSVHEKNAAKLESIVGEHGWPGVSLVGDDGADAAWLLLQHAISRPDLMHRFLPLLRNESKAGEIPGRHVAYVEDRICFFEGRPQVYGTHFALNDRGQSDFYVLADPTRLNERRSEMGLDPVSLESYSEPSLDVVPEPVRRERSALADWARSVGWKR